MEGIDLSLRLSAPSPKRLELPIWGTPNPPPVRCACFDGAPIGGSGLNRRATSKQVSSRIQQELFSMVANVSGAR
eukprot:scaffold10020_cov122-Isochrysis_galbana.AAC.3